MEQPDAFDTSRATRSAWPLALGLLAIAASTRVWYALTKSLVLDEFHSTYHAFAASGADFLSRLALDNHPPLSFLLIGTASEALGRSELALRSPAIVLGLVEIALVARLAAQLGASRGRALLAAALLATSAMHFDYGTQVRMYVPHALMITACLSAFVTLVREDGEGRRGAAICLAIGAAAALHTHYYAFQYLTVLAAAGAVAVGLAPGRVARLALPLIAALAAFLPWGLTGFRAQLGHGLPPGGDDLGPAALAETFIHLFTHNVSFVGSPAKWIFVAGAGLALLLAARGAWLLLADRERRSQGILVSAVAFGVPAAAWLLATISPRAGFTWHYCMPSAAAASVLAGIGARGAVAMAAASAQVALGTALIGIHLAHPATEDFRGAIRHALTRHSVAEAAGLSAELVAVEWQPALFPQGRPYDYYAPRLMKIEPPPRAPMVEGGFFVKDMTPLLAADRVIVVTRSLPPDQPLRARLREAFPARTVTNFGYGVDVIEYAPRP